MKKFLYKSALTVSEAQNVDGKKLSSFMPSHWGMHNMLSSRFGFYHHEKTQRNVRMLKCKNIFLLLPMELIWLSVQQHHGMKPSCIVGGSWLRRLALWLHSSYLNRDFRYPSRSSSWREEGSWVDSQRGGNSHKWSWVEGDTTALT